MLAEAAGIAELAFDIAGVGAAADSTEPVAVAAAAVAAADSTELVAAVAIAVEPAAHLRNFQISHERQVACLELQPLVAAGLKLKPWVVVR